MTISKQQTEPGPAPQPDDEVLVTSTCQGDTAAFDLLVQRYQGRAVSVSLRLLGNSHDALEVVQEAFIRAYRNIETLQNRKRFRSWLLRIVTNLSLNQRRDRAAAQQMARLDDGDQDLPAERGRGYGESPAAGLQMSETQARLTDAVSGLPDHQRTALVLFCLEQLPQKEVAGIMGCSVEAVKWHVFQARKTLRRNVGDLLREP